MTKHFNPLVIESALPLKVREDDPIAAATAAVNDLRTANEEFRTRMEGELRQRDERIAQLEVRANRPGLANENRNEPSEEMRHFQSWLRAGGATEYRALTGTGGDSGPNLIPPAEFLQEIQRNLVLVSPIRGMSRVIGVDNPNVILPKRTANLQASWVNESDAEPATTPTYGQQEVAIYEAKASVAVSNRLIEDSAFDISADIAFDLAQEYGRLEGAAFVAGTGSGAKQPLGIINTTGINTVTSATVDAITADDVLDTFYSVPTFYANQGTWIANRATLAAIRKLKTTIGSYIWQDSFQANTPSLLLGRPVVEAPDMPNIGDNAIALAFGAFNLGFRIFDRIALTMLRDPFSQASNGLVVFHSRRRLGAALTLPEAFTFLKIQAAA